jgi:hypothetical protein
MQKVVISRDVFIDETNTNFPDTDVSVSETLWFPPYETQPEVNLPELANTNNTRVFTQTTPELSSPVLSPEQMETETESSTDPVEETRPCEIIPVPNVDPDVPAVVQEQSKPEPRRSLRVSVPTEKYREWKESLGLVSLVDPQEPQTYTEAVASDDSLLWKAAIDDEYSSLMTNETWTLQSLPPGRVPILAKWIFKIKPGSKDTPTRYKARLVAKGYTQKYGLDYQDTYSPVVKPNSLCTVLALVAARNLELIQLDIKTAFMYGELKEELYLEQPEGFVVPGRENDVCRLQKSLYGLKQAPRAWNNKFNEFLVKFGLSRCSSDHCVYYRRQEEEITFVLFFVDDGLVCSNRANTLTDILEHLKTFFEVRSFPANRFLGLDINRDCEKRQLHLSQPDFISKILERFNMQTCHPKGTPADPNARLSNLMQPADLVADHQHTPPVPYREAIGSLIKK